MTKHNIQAIYRRQDTVKWYLFLYFHSLSMKTFTLVENNHLETFREFRKMIWLFEFLVSGFRCEDLIL